MNRAKVLITRTQSEGEAFFAGHLEVIEPIYYPVFEIVPKYDARQIHDILSRLDSYHWILFTSRNTVRIFMDILHDHNKRLPKTANIATVGSRTAEAVQAHGHEVRLVPEREDARGLLAELPGIIGREETEVLLPQGEAAPTLLRDGLAQAGRHVTHCTLYKTCPADPQTLPKIDIDTIAWYVFTNPLSVKFFKDLGHELPGHCQIAAIGQPTAEALQANFRAPDYVPHKADGHDIVNKIRELL